MLRYSPIDGPQASRAPGPNVSCPPHVSSQQSGGPEGDLARLACVSVYLNEHRVGESPAVGAVSEDRTWGPLTCLLG